MSCNRIAYEEIVKGTQIPFYVSMTDSLPVPNTPKSITALADLQYWIYTDKADIVKISRADMQMVDDYNYLFYFDSGLVEQGVLYYEVYIKEVNANVVPGGNWEPRASVKTNVKIVEKPISEL